MSPNALIDSLYILRRRVKVLGVAYGLGLLCAALVALLILTILLDYALNLPAGPRLFVAAAAICALGYIFTQYVAHTMLARLKLGDVAGRLESAFPQFDDRLRSTVNFAASAVPGSSAMQQRVMGETASLASSLNLGSAIVAAPVWWSLAAGIGSIALAMVMALYVVSPQYRDIALARLFSPFGNHPWPKRVRIDMVSQVPQRVAVGQRLDVRMKLGKGDRRSTKAVVFSQYDDGPVQQELMTRAQDGTYAVSLDTRVESGKPSSGLKIWIKAGDDEMRLAPVTVVPRLGIRTVEALVTPPQYVAVQSPTNVNLTASPALVGVGSKIALRVTFNKPLSRSSEFELVPATDNTKPPAVSWQRTSAASVQGTWLASDSLRFHIRATDVDGFTNSALEEYEIIVRPDQSPSVQIEQPRKSEERTAVATVPLIGLAEDDYGIRSLKLVVDRVSDKRHWEIDLVENAAARQNVGWTRVGESGERQRYRANCLWELSALDKADLRPGDVLEYYLLVTDNFALNGATHEPVASGRLRILIISQEELTSRVIDELRQAKQHIAELKIAQVRTTRETANLAQDTKDKPKLDAADAAALERLTAGQSATASQTKTLAGRVGDLQRKLEENKSTAQDLKDLSRDVSSDLNRAAENPMKDSTLQLSSVAQPNQSKDARQQAMDKAQQSEQAAADQLQQAMDRMSSIGTLQQTIDMINQLLAEQKEITKATAEAGRDHLGKKPEQMNPQDRKKLDDAADRQSKLAERTAKALEDMKSVAEQTGKSDPTASEAMKRAGDTARQQQVQPKQQQAAQQTKQNQQAGAQASQKQVELGLEMMLSELREAERARLAELSKKLEELQKQVANLIRRQAGHNLDDLSLQGPERLAKIAADVVSDLNNKAQRDPTAPVKTTLAQLTQSQEQTERNTRDISKQADSVPNGAEPAAHLLRAAGKMERAIFALREAHLPDAYDPHQIEALAALEAAKKIIDEQKTNVDDQMNDADRESVRQKYVKIREDQEKVNVETTRIDSARDD
ncbi:MAG: DUF4175 family protein, partial [Tepidisphaeraceae bacterium]